MTTNYLFNKNEIRSYLGNLSNHLASKIEKLTKESFTKSTIEDLASQYESDYSIEVPTINKEEMYMKEPEEIQIRTQGRMYSSAIKTPGMRYTFKIPFNGDSELFSVLPTTYSSRFPYGTVSKNEITVTYEISGRQEPEKIKAELDANVALMERYLETLRNDVKNFNENFNKLLIGSLTARKSKIDKDDDAAKSFGLPIRK